MAHHTGMFAWRCAVPGLCIAVAAGSATAKCKLSQIALLPVTMIDMKPMVMANINGADAMFAANSGAFFSILNPAAAAEFKLKTYPAPSRLVVTRLGGAAQVSVAMVKEFMLAGQSISNIEFLVGGGAVGGGGAGLLGQNVFRIGDVEYDLAKGVIRLLREDGCDKTSLAYWASPADNPQTFSNIDIQLTTPLQPHTTATAYVNGAKMRVMFDTGAYASSLSVRAAARAGIKVDSAAATYVGLSRGIGREQVKTWIATIGSFKLGDEEIKNARLRISESSIDSVDMLLGVDFFLAHHVYVASRQGRLFFTYNGGPVFNLAALHAATTTPAPVEDGTPVSPLSDEPKDAAEYSRRGTAFGMLG